jgi:DNA-binding NarL/FixJ family response regulator
MEKSVEADGGSEFARELTIVVCEDHALYAQGLLRALEEEAPDIELVAVTERVRECVQVVEETLPQFVLMDIALPEIDGIEGTRQIRAVAPLTNVVMLTASEEPDDLFRALKAGAAAYIVKDQDIVSIVETLHQVARGNYLLPAWAAGKVSGVIQKQPGVALTEEEELLLEALGSGDSQKAIARRLELTDRTVRRRTRVICDKLHLADRLEAAVYALREGLRRKDR